METSVNNKCKAFTSLEQSRKLSEILPFESADMFLAMNGILPIMSKYIDSGLVTADETAIPCWSLVALLDVLPKYIGGSVLRMDMSENDFSLWFDDLSGIVDEILPDITKDNPVDACYEMVIKLDELNLL